MDEADSGSRASLSTAPADAEPLILVDAADRELGHLSKAECHAGRGVLHRAFSILIFNDAGELLLQQRSAQKRLWPLYWSNSCCSHPRRAESLESASRRRLHEELGLTCALQFLFKFEYQAQFDATGAEHELCSVFIGHSARQQPRINRHEIHNWRWIGQAAVRVQMDSDAGARFTPWFRLEWARIQRDYAAALPSSETR